MLADSSIRRLVVSIACVVCSSWAAPAIEQLPPRASAPYETSWFLIRLTEPLADRGPDDSFPLRTTNLQLDALIDATGVWRIESALPKSTRQTRFREKHRQHGLDRIYKFFVPPGSEVPALIKRFSKLPGVEYAEPDYLIQLDAVVPDDARFSDQWNLDQPSDADVDAPEAWEFTVGEGVIIGMNDSGVDSDHEDLAGKILPGWDFVNDDDDPEDDNGHGTRTSSVATANTDNAVGIAGACWRCSIMPAKVFNALGQGSHARSADGYVWLTDHGARVINQSGGGPIPSATLYAGVSYAYDAGVVMASGTGNKNSTAINYPAAYDEVIAAGGTDQFDQRASFSNYGAQINVVAPAVAILTAQMGGGYSPANGNSFAGPHVSGLAGLIETIYPSVGRDEAKHLVYSGAEDQIGRPIEDTPGWDQYHGWGRINMQRTLEATRSSASLRVEGKTATRLFLETANPTADAYDFVRGELGVFSETASGVNAGDVVCLENDSLDPDTAGGNEDDALPLPGDGFFYLGRFRSQPGTGGYGGSSRNRDRMPSSGDCSS
ncbi:MAG: S8 family serine peptidase [Acidobacteriota bacterium]|nr:MAG: S8 family serine peptidase [Acidobacteriota bacterium]